MGLPQFEVPAGTIDGVNGVFFTSVPYAPGTLAVLINGQLIDFGAFAETTPNLGRFTITSSPCIPKTGVWGTDELQVFFVDLGDEVAVQQVFPISGNIVGSLDADGLLAVPALNGGLAPAADLSGTLAPVQLTGNVEAAAQLSGLLECD